MAAVIPSIGQFNWGADLNDFLATLATREKPEVFKNKNLTDVSNKFPAALSPIGSIVDWTGANAPSGWRFCDGATLQRSAYPDLFNQIGTVHGAGDGTTTFALPKIPGASVAWTNIPAPANWTVVPDPLQPAWFRDGFRVMLRGRIGRNFGSISSGDIMLTVPETIRPNVQAILPYATGLGPSSLNVLTNGQITAQVAAPGGSATAIFDSLSWHCSLNDSSLPIQRIIRTN